MASKPARGHEADASGMQIHTLTRCVGLTLSTLVAFHRLIVVLLTQGARVGECFSAREVAWPGGKLMAI